MPQLRYLATAAALAIVVAQPPVAASAHGGGGHGGHFGGGHAFAGRHFGVGRSVVGGCISDPRFDRQFGRFGGRAIFGVGGIFLWLRLRISVSVSDTQATTLPGIARKYTLRLQPCRGLLLSVSWPGVLMRSHYQTAVRRHEYIACDALPCAVLRGRTF